MIEKKIKVLVIEDDEFMRVFLKDVFWIHDGNECTFMMAANLSKGREILADPASKPNLVFLDLNLPEVDGGTLEIEGTFKLLEELKSNEKTKDIKIIIFSAFGDKELKDRAAKLGADRYLVKGENLPREIMQVVWEMLGKKE